MASDFDFSALRAFESSLQLPPGHAPITPIASPEDTRQYRVITLANGLTALLISDPTTDKAAASLDVNVGSFAEDMMGLAHFLEHMLFMGTKKYPDENSYSLAINNYGGSQNAFTAREHTNYLFDVTKDHLEEVLDRFAQFFVAPLCLDTCVEREQLAVNNEHEKNIQSDYWRIAQLSEGALNADHPVSKFATGNLLTLRDEPKAKGIDTREELMKFYRAHYSANLMKLCVLGKEDLSTLEQWVTASFSDVPNNQTARPDYTSIPVALPGVHTQTLTRIVPVKNYRSLEIEWIFPPTHHQFLSEPTKLLVHILGHEAEGSLAYHLKQLSYINELTAQDVEQNSSYSIGLLEFELTELGLTKVPEILELTFGYIHMIQTSMDTTPQVWKDDIYPEVRAVEEMEFRFAEKSDPIWFCVDRATDLSHTPAKYVLSGGCLAEYDESALKRTAKVYGAVEQCRVRVIAPEFKSIEGLQKEKWYGTEYTQEYLSADLVDRLKSAQPVPEFRLPKVNPFIATDFSLRHGKSEDAAKTNPTPKRMVCTCNSESTAAAADASATAASSSSAELFFVPDTTFGLPKVDVSIQISNSLVSRDPLSKSCASLWSDLVDDALSELNHYAGEAGLNSYSWPTNGGLMLKYDGYSHKICDFVRTLLPQLRQVRATGREEQFARLKEAQLRKLTEYNKDTPLHHARDDSNTVRLDKHITVAEELSSFSSLTPLDLDSFVDQWLRAASVYVLVNGNFSESEAQELTRTIQTVFPLAKLLPSQEYVNRCINLPDTHQFVRQAMSKNVDDTNSSGNTNINNSREDTCCLNVYQIGVSDETMDAHMNVISHILSDALFDQLRTKETLGYLVHGYHNKTANVLHYQVAVQSSDASAAYLNMRIEAFMVWFRYTQFAALVKETPDFLERNKNAVILSLTEKDKNLGDEHRRFWGEIEKRRFDWTRHDRVAREVEKITEESLFAFYDKYLLASTPNSMRRKLSFQYFSSAHTLPQRIERETNETNEYGNVKLATKPLAPAAGGGESDSKGEEAASVAAAAPAAAAEEIYLPPVAVDPRPIRYIDDDLIAFKRTLPMYPAML